MSDDIEQLLTINEVAVKLKVSKRTLARWDKTGKLPAIQFDPHAPRRYKESDIQKFVEGNTGVKEAPEPEQPQQQPPPTEEASEEKKKGFWW